MAPAAFEGNKTVCLWCAARDKNTNQIPIIIQWCYWWRSLSGNNWLQKVITDQLESSISESCLKKPWKKMNTVRKRERSCFSSSNTMSTLAYLFHSRRTTKPKWAKCIPRFFLSHSKDNVLFSSQQMNGYRCDVRKLMPARNIKDSDSLKIQRLQGVNEWGTVTGESLLSRSWDGY